MEPSARRFWLQLGLLGAILVAYHLIMREVLAQHLAGLTDMGPDTVPLYARWDPRLGPWQLPALGLVAALALWMRRQPPLPTGLTLAGLGLAAIAVTLAIQCIDGGWATVVTPMTRTDLEYVGGVARVEGVADFFARYVELQPSLPMHAQTHPPGAVLLYWLLGQLVGTSPGALALAVVVLAALAVPAVWLLARDLGAPPTTAALLYIVVPSVALFSATCTDAVFAAPFAWAVLFLWRGRARSPLLHGALAGLAGLAALLLTFSALFLPLWGLGVLVATRLWQRERAESTLVTLVVAGLTAGLGLMILWRVTGFDLLACLRTGMLLDQGIQGSHGYHSLAQGLHLRLGNLMAFAVGVGLPLVVLWGQRLRLALAARRSDPGPAVLMTAFAAAVLFMALAPLYKMETERHWLFMVPLVVVPASLGLERRTLVFALLAGQTLVMESLLYTFW